jgi:transposase
MIVTKVPTQKSFLERAAWLAGANFLAIALSFLTPLVIVRIFDQTEFGTYKQLFQILTTVMTALYLQVPMSAYYFMPREPKKRLQVAMNIVLFYMLIGLLAALIFAAHGGWITYVFNNPALDEYIPLLGVALALWLIATNIEVFPLALGDVRTASMFIVVAQISKSLILICSAVMFGSLRAILWGSIIQGVIHCGFMLAYVHFRIGSLKVRPDRLFDLPLLRKQLSNSLPYGGGATAQGLQADLHNYFVSYYFSAASFAVYANGCFQVPLVSALQGSFRDALTPEVARLEASGDYKSIIHAWLNAVRRLSFVVLPACALMFVVRRELIVTLFTEAYADSAQIFSIYLVAMMAQAVLLSPIMRSIADFRYYRLKFTLAQIPLACVALYAGIKLGGLVGAVTAAVCLNVFDSAVGVAAICRKLGVKRSDLRQLAPIANAAPAIIIAMIASSAVKTLTAPAYPIVTLGACAVVFAFIYVVGSLLFGALTPEDQDAMHKQAQRLSRKFTSFTSLKIPKPVAAPETPSPGRSKISVGADLRVCPEAADLRISVQTHKSAPTLRPEAADLRIAGQTRRSAPTLNRPLLDLLNLNRSNSRRPVTPASPLRRRPLLIRNHHDFTPEFKARAVLQLLQDSGSAAQICRELQINERLLSDWKEQFMKKANLIFENEPAIASANERIAELERMVGRLKRELESERIAELERLVGRLMLELEESKRGTATLSAAARSNGGP